MKVSFRLSAKVDVQGRSEILLTTQVKVGGRVVKMRSKSEVRVRREFFSAERGVDVSRRRVLTAEEREYHAEMLEKLNGILAAVARAEIGADKEAMACDWLRGVVQKHLHPERMSEKQNAGTYSELVRKYLEERKFSDDTRQGHEITARSVLRYEGYVRATDVKRRDFVFDVHTVDRGVLQDYFHF